MGVRMQAVIDKPVVHGKAASMPRPAARSASLSRKALGSLFLLVLAILLGACSLTPYRFEPLESSDLAARATAMSSGGFDVRAYVPGAGEAEDLLGIDVYGRDIQPVWLEIHNRNDTRGRVVITSIDPKYFPPAEVAWFFKKQYSKQGWMDLEARLIELALPRRIEPGETASGFVFTNRSPGTKAFNLDVFQGTLPLDYEQFTFFLRVPGFVPDYLDVRFEELYETEEIEVVATDELPAVLERFPCCTTDQSGERQGQPVNVFIVAEPPVLLRSLLRAGWAETPADEVGAGSVHTHTLLGRPADGTFRKPRDGLVDRSELAIWKTPIRVDGKPLWAAQSRQAIGRRFPLGERLFGVRLDPDTSEGRNYVLQSFWYAQALARWAMASTNVLVPENAPAIDFLDNPWFSRDGNDVVIWLSDQPVPMNEANFVDWTGGVPVRGGTP